MWKYEKMLAFPINVTKRDLRLAKVILSQYGGPQGELGAALRYLNQSYTMPDDYGKALLKDIGTEELSHVEMLCELVVALTKGATIKEIKDAHLEDYYTEHGLDLYAQNASGLPFDATIFSAVGDVIANIHEDMAAEEKARAVYEHLIDLTDDEEVQKILLFLRQREIVHYARFKELLEHYQAKMNE